MSRSATAAKIKKEPFFSSLMKPSQFSIIMPERQVELIFLVTLRINRSLWMIE